MRKSRLCGILLMCILTAAKPAMAVSAEEIPAAAPRETVSVTEEESEIENVSEDADRSSNADLSNEDRAEETLSETGGTDHDALAQDPVEDSSGKAEDEADPAAPSGSEAVSGTEDIEDPEAVSDTKDIEEPEAVSDAEGAENPEAVSGTEIPFLMLFTVVENSFKHAMNLYSTMELNIVCEPYTGEDFRGMRMTVEDNGDGFSPEVLAHFSGPMPDELPTKDHLGLSNVQYTLRYVYRRDGLLRLSNLEHGARTEILIPGEVKKSEAADL